MGLPMRVLLYDSSGHFPGPLFLEALEQMTARPGGGLTCRFVDQGAFTDHRNSLGIRVLRRLLRRSAVDIQGLNREFGRACEEFQPDLILVCKGAFLLPDTLKRAKEKTGAVLVNYATDDPFNRRVSTPYLLESIPLYDLYACTKRAIISDVERAGCARAVHVPFGYKPEVHFKEEPQNERERERFAQDVVFIGGCDRDRVPFFRELIRALPNLRLALYGGYWNRWPLFRKYWRGFAVGRDFRLALSGAKIAINLVRRANRDDHVMRTFEIPACGGVLLNERTHFHLETFRENVEALYFESPEEMVSKVRVLLDDQPLRERLRMAAYNTVRSISATYCDRLRTLLDLAMASKWPPQNLRARTQSDRARDVLLLGKH